MLHAFTVCCDPQDTFNAVRGFMGRFETVEAQVAADAAVGPLATPAPLSASALALQWLQEDKPLPPGSYHADRLQDCSRLPVETAAGSIVPLGSRR